jgi:hypothetical protein
MGTSGVGKGPDFGDDEPTIIDGAPYADETTPVEPPLCPECGGITFVDGADNTLGFPDDRCLHSSSLWKPSVPRWHWCHRLRKTVSYVPR